MTDATRERESNALLNPIHRLDEEMETLIGRKVFGHVSAPTKTSLRITFGDGHVCLTMAEAHDYMHGLVKQARQDPSKLPWPLCEPRQRHGTCGTCHGDVHEYPAGWRHTATPLSCAELKPLCERLVAATGAVLTPELEQQLADEAERGYDPDKLRSRSA